MIRRATVTLLLIAACAAPAAAQPPEELRLQLDALAGDIAKELKAGATPEEVRTLLVSGSIRPNLVLLAGAAGVDFVNIVAEAEEARTDEQLGSGPSSSGTTSLVSKGGIPSMLAMAVENGALSQSISGTTITFRGTPVGIVSALQGKGFVNLLPTDETALSLLSNLSFSASFDSSRGATEDDGAVFRREAQQLSQWSVRWVAINRRNPQLLRYAPLWTDVGGVAGVLGALVNDTREFTQTDPLFQAWLAGTAAELSAAAMPGTAVDQAVVREILANRFANLAATSPATTARLRGVSNAFTDVIAARASALERIAEGLLVTLEYTNERPTTGPTLSNTRFIAQVGGGVDLTGNASVTWFNGTPPAGADRVRDLQAALQVDVPLTRYSELGTFVLAFAVRYERLQTDPAAVLAGAQEGGNVGIGQIKLVIPIKGSGVRIPISVTFANRTELIREKVIRGNVGLSYDLDSLFARVRPR